MLRSKVENGHDYHRSASPGRPSLAEIGPADFGRVRAKPIPRQPSLLSTLGQLWGSCLPKRDTLWSIPGQAWPHLAHVEPTLAEHGPDLAESEPELAVSWPILVEVGAQFQPTGLGPIWENKACAQKNEWPSFRNAQCPTQPRRQVFFRTSLAPPVILWCYTGELSAPALARPSLLSAGNCACLCNRSALALVPIQRVRV